MTDTTTITAKEVLLKDLNGNYLIPYVGTKVNAMYDSDGNVIADTYVTKADAETTYLGIDETAASATVASRIGDDTVGGTAQPIYLNEGTATACSASFSSYLPLSGGTMTGDIYTSASNQLIIGYKHSNANGGLAAFRGAGYENNPYGIDFFAQNGTTQSLLQLFVDGRLSFASGSIYAVSFNATSDKRLKSGITEKTIDLSSITPYSYYLTNDKKQAPHVGLIAQEVEEVLPEAVSEGVDGYKTLDYNAVTAALVGEVYALKKRIQALEKADGE